MTKKVLLVLAFAIAPVYAKPVVQISTENTINSYSANPWHLTQFIFETQVENKLSHQLHHSMPIPAIMAAAFIAYQSYNSTPSSDTPKEASSSNKLFDTCAKISTGVCTMFAGGTLYSWYKCYLTRNIQKETLVSFLSKWELYRDRMPSCLVDMFDEVANAFQEHGTEIITDKLVAKVFELVKHHISHNVKSEKDKKSDVLGTVKTVTGIFKDIS